VNAYQADQPAKPVVLISADQCTLPRVLRHIEAGEVVIMIPPPRLPPPDD
jgi:hypothetical protein